MSKTLINIIFSTKKIENTTNLLRSLQKISLEKNEKIYTLSISIFDKTIKQNLISYVENFDLPINVISNSKIQELEEKYPEYLLDANCNIMLDSIQRARIQQQIYIIDNNHFFKNSIIWQVDDDILFGKSEYNNNKHKVSYSTDYFSEIVKFYNQNKQIDAVIAPTSYVPPIPSLLYCKTQLEDLFNHEYMPMRFDFPMEYHDYYNQNNKDKFYSLFLSKAQDINIVVKDILIGKPTTRVNFTKNKIEKAVLEKSKALRGGNFIVFNVNLFKIPHLGFSENDSIPTRRSDMIHSKLLLELGFKVVDVDYFSLVHNRTFTSASIENSVEKYFSDMIGALLVQYVYKGKNEFVKRLNFHQNHIKNILKLLIDNVDISKFEKEIKKLKELDFEINSFNEKHFIKEFENFKKNKEQLIIKLCKLAS